MRRLNGVDALMLYLDGGSAYNHTLKISVLDPSTDPDGWSWPKARRMFEERTHLLPVLRLRYLPTPLGLHHPIWVEDPEFDLDAHLRRVVCPAPGGMEEFCTLVEQVYAHPLDRDRPLWQVWVVEGLEGGRVALVMLLHHAYTDGIGVLDMLGSFYNDTPDDAAVVPAPWTPQPLPSTRQRLGWALRDLPARLGRVAPTARAVRDRVRIERGVRRGRPATRPVHLRPLHAAGTVPVRAVAHPTVLLRDVPARRGTRGEEGARRHDQRRLHGVRRRQRSPAPQAGRLTARRGDGGHDAARDGVSGRTHPAGQLLVGGLHLAAGSDRRPARATARDKCRRRRDEASTSR